MRDHDLTGNYKGTRECHIEPDWLLIYEIQNNVDARNPLDLDWPGGLFWLFATSVIWSFIFPYYTVFRMVALFMSRYIVLTW